MQPEYLLYFARFIEKELRIVYAEHNFFQLQNRLEEITKIYALPNLEALHEKAKGGMEGTFKQLVLDIATNNETSFFRDPKVFQAIENIIIPALISGKLIKERLSIWSAACSSGQEPYTLSILMSEMLRKNPNAFDYEILATDISQRVLERAATGRFSQLEVQRGLSAMLMVKCFTKDDQDYWNIQPELKAKIEFKKQNLKEPLALKNKFHLILCRNVLIYQKVESKAEIVKRITEQLLPGGYLVLGAGESLLGVSTDYEALIVDGVVLYQLKKEMAQAAA
jgi:chemotaxis protein methyltransferase CheR